MFFLFGPHIQPNSQNDFLEPSQQPIVWIAIGHSWNPYELSSPPLIWSLVLQL